MLSFFGLGERVNIAFDCVIKSSIINNVQAFLHSSTTVASHFILSVSVSRGKYVCGSWKIDGKSLQKLACVEVSDSLEVASLSRFAAEDKYDLLPHFKLIKATMMSFNGGERMMLRVEKNAREKNKQFCVRQFLIARALCVVFPTSRREQQ